MQKDTNYVRNDEEGKLHQKQKNENKKQNKYAERERQREREMEKTDFLLCLFNKQG